MADWIEPGSVHLVVTSPPYALMRADKYGGVEPEAYPDWWMQVMSAIDGVLAPGGSVVVNWQSGRDGCGHKHTWDIRSELAMLDSGWALCNEYVWNKLNPMPGRYKYAFTKGITKIT